jgi:hypothetical protein
LPTGQSYLSRLSSVPTKLEDKMPRRQQPVNKTQLGLVRPNPLQRNQLIAGLGLEFKRTGSGERAKAARRWFSDAPHSLF